MGFTNSPLVTYKNLTKNMTSPRNHAIDTITIHCVVGQWTAKQGCDYFAKTDRQCSANYVVGKDGSIGLSVEEKNRSWCSSSSSNDHRAITIEVASDTAHPYAVTAEAYAALIELVADICKRNGIKELLWKADKSLVGDVSKQNMTVHRWFANKACPGEYLYSRHGEIAAEVNKRLNVPAEEKGLYRIQTEISSKKDAEEMLTKLKDSGFEGFVLIAETDSATDEKPFAPYLVKVTAGKDIHKSAGTNTTVVGKVTRSGVYTIVEEANGTGASRWGKLKSGAGWISLDNTTKI